MVYLSLINENRFLLFCFLPIIAIICCGYATFADVLTLY